MLTHTPGGSTVNNKCFTRQNAVYNHAIKTSLPNF